VLVAGLFVTVAACTPSLPKPAPPPTSAVPVVTEAQIVAIMDSLAATLEEADGALDIDAAAARLEGPALDVRRADYVVAGAGHDLRPFFTERDAKWTVTGQTTSWPRVVLVSTKQPSDLVGTPRILVLRQDAPREQYRLWGWAGLGSEMVVPDMTVPQVGSQVLPDNARTLVMAPSDVLERYADLLQKGDDSQYADQFTSDMMRGGIEATRAKILARKGDGQYKETFEAPEGPVAVFATADGGALVIGQVTMTVEAKGIEVTSAVPSDPMPIRVSALAGGEMSTSMTWTYTDVIVFMVPSADKGGPVVVFAYAHTVTAAAKL